MAVRLSALPSGGPLLCTQVVSWAPSFLGQGLRSGVADSMGMHVLNFCMCCQVAFRNGPLDGTTSTVKRAFSAPWLGLGWPGVPFPRPVSSKQGSGPEPQRGSSSGPTLSPPQSWRGADTRQPTVPLLPGTSSPWSRPPPPLPGESQGVSDVVTGQRLTLKGAEHHDGEAGPRSGWETGLKPPRTQTQVPETVLTRGPGALPAHFTSTSSPPPFQAHPVAPFPSPASGPRPVPDTHTGVTARPFLDPSRWRRGTGSE